ncbi:hypothetical protein KIPB_015100, partial [Kipferlia bialata]|eukprot:g15100.t1
MTCISMVEDMVEMVRDDDYELDTICSVAFGCAAEVEVSVPEIESKECDSCSVLEAMMA